MKIKICSMVVKLCILGILIAPARQLVSEKLFRFGRCIAKNIHGKKMKVRLYRENERTGKIENNDSNAWPVRIINSEFKKLKGYDMNRVYLPNITEIKMKTKMGVDPVIFRNNDNVEIYGMMVIKYGFPRTIKKREDYINRDNSIKYDMLAGRKFQFQLLENGIRLMIRCTIINPDIGDYTGYIFPKKFSQKVVDFKTVMFKKNDYLTTKELIASNDIDHLQLKLDGLDKVENKRREIRAQKREKRIREKIKDKVEKEKLMKQGFSAEEIKKKKISMKHKVAKDKSKLTKKYQKDKKKVAKQGTVEEFNQKDDNAVSMTPVGANLEGQDIRISQEEEEIRNNTKAKKNEDDVTEEVSFQQQLDYIPNNERKSNRRFSMKKDLEKYHAKNRQLHHHHRRERMLSQARELKNTLCLI